ncbi:hypothetical protein AMTR_s00053p00148710 [Amborella trichopoda]|uniref:Bifunctional inhibitor/plant lipid transfer protein/seed storage helical domain-containing protein n=1 Tax=Amborella trichopoda TaxID=13333 RepID=W1PAX5_AMBTC|nr:hypothetical protein AMTR_s00053p00148710 [Amborella trichopoda]
MGRVITTVGFLMVLVMAMFESGTAGTGCQNDLQALMTSCLPYVTKTGPQIPPSAACCSAVVVANMPCVCNYVTKEVEALIDIQKVIFVAQSCKRPLPSGTKCGSKCPQLLL